MKLVFDFSAYKPYLKFRVGDYRQRKGLRSLIAKAMGCQPTFVSQVLNGDFHFSLEQADQLGKFLGHTGEEQDFFMLLLQHERAATKDLKVYFKRKIDAELSARTVLTHRLGQEKTLSSEQQNIYYSSWHYGAIHMAIAIPKLQTHEAISDYLHLPIKKVSEVLEYLISVGLVEKQERGYKIGSANLRLGKSSHNILRHHANWRMLAVESLDREEELDLHYSGVFCLSESARALIKNKIFEALEEILKVSDEAKEESLACMNIDFFHLKR
jgi:uncharacterized protein (TIGR02147 family)